MTFTSFARAAVVALALPALILLAACGDGGEELTRAEVEEIARAEAQSAAPPPAPPGLTRAEVREIVEAAIAAIPEGDSGLTAAQVEGIVRGAIAAIPESEPGLTAAEVREIVVAAIAAVPATDPGLSAAEVEGIVVSAIAAIPATDPGLTAAEVAGIVQTAIAAMPEPEPGLSAEEARGIARGAVAAIPLRSTPAEYTRFFVENAISRYESQGLEATLAHYSRPDSVDGQWYVFIIAEDGRVMAHYESHLLGQDLKGPLGTDANGYNFGPDMLSATADGRWVSYVYRNPASGTPGSDASGEMELKNVWVVRHDGLLFASGWYVDADQFTQDLVDAAVRIFPVAGLEGTIAYFASPESEFAGLRSAIDYYNSADNVEGDWFAFIADRTGTLIDHYDKSQVGTTMEDLFGPEAVEATGDGAWVTTEDLRVWVVGDDGMTFGSGWLRGGE